MKGVNVPPLVAAKLLGKDVSFVLRTLVAHPGLIGVATPTGQVNRRGEPRYTYNVTAHLLKQYTGKTDEDIAEAEAAVKAKLRAGWGSRGCRKKLPGRLREL